LSYSAGPGRRTLRVAALGILPIGDQFELLGKASVGAEWSNWSRAEPWVAVDKRSFSLGLGVGARYWINDHAALRLDIDGINRDEFVAAGTRHKFNMGSTTLGFQYRF